MKIPELNEGERYAGIIIGSATGQPTHHLILIPQQPKTHLTWDEAIAQRRSRCMNLLGPGGRRGNR